MTTTSATLHFDRAAICKAAWVQARAYISAGVERLQALRVAMRAAWAAAKEPKEPVSFKSVVRALDRAAARARNGATERQTAFLASLMLKAGEDGSEYVLDTTIALSRRDASSMIDHYLGR